MVRFMTSNPPSRGTMGSAGSSADSASASSTVANRPSTARPVEVSSSDRAALVSSSEEVLRHRLSHSVVGRSRADRRASGSSPDNPTAIVMSAFTEAIGAIGMGLRMPPSASSRPSSTCGEMTPGMAIEARIASETSPCCNHTALPAIRSVQTAVNGMGKSSIVLSPRISRTASRIFSARRIPAAVSDGSSRRSTVRCVKELAQVLYSSSLPAACSPPTSAPIEDPAVPTMSCPRSLSSLITPMWA